jgi:hypothetical protein
MPDAGLLAHQEWLGLIQPVGLVVAPTALVAAQVELDASLREKWLNYDALLLQRDDDRVLSDFAAFARQFLEWTPEQLAGALGGPPLPATLTVHLPEFDDQLEPSFAVPDPLREGEWLLLVRVEGVDTQLDRISDDEHNGWSASPHERFERLLRETGIGAGVIVAGQTIRLVYAPRGESSGYLSFPVGTMATPHGRPMLLALYQLLKGWRLSRACPETSGLRRLLVESRKYQNVVSTKLAEQVLGALYELTRGFQAADDAAGGRVLQETLRQAHTEVYGGLLTIIMRLVFVLYAEERGMLPQEAAWVEHYGVGALFERLRNDKARYPDTMDQRYGAWAQLLSLFRILHDGASHGAIRIPAREGELFDPDRYPFLEGRPFATRRVLGDRLPNVPRVSDGTFLRVLERLLMLDEERLSYRALDVEQIGSVYEAMMGFEVRAATGRSISVKPKTKKPGSPSHPVVDLDALLAAPGPERVKWLKEEADSELPGGDATPLKEATNIEGLLQALERRISDFTPQPVNRGALVLVPTEERRRSGSHYTPRELTEPIVATTLRPVLEAFGAPPTADQLLELRICDPAMGSGAFLVGACRFVGERLVEAWQRSGNTPAIPPDEDVQLYARRLVAQRCLFGVDRNPYAVQLAKLSLWLVTLAREHPFTFLDHALRSGDSLVGLTCDQVTAFHWDAAKASDPRRGKSIWAPQIEDWIEEAEKQRQQIETLAGTDDTREKLRLLREADDNLRVVRRLGDAVVAAFFSSDKNKKREELRKSYEQSVAAALGAPGLRGRLDELADQLREREPPITPFHWEIEFPEVFGRENPGFDAIVGNPPFAGKNTLINSNPEHYLDWLQTIHDGAHGNSDLVAHFFRRAFGLLREGGAFGLIATNTIAQGDTRATGLRWLRQHGCTIYEARRRYRWPGAAAVVVSVVHGVRGAYSGPYLLDGCAVERITAFLFHAGGDEDPAPLSDNAGKSFIGSYLLGMGFTFDDDNPDATPIAEMHRLIAENPKNAEVLFPYIGGEEVNDSPTHAHRRYVINFGEMNEAEVRAGWPKLMEILETKVKPQRLQQRDEQGRLYWWRFLRTRPELQSATTALQRLLVVARVSNTLAFTFLPRRIVANEKIVVFAFDGANALALLTSRCHETWARFFSSSLKDDLQYTPSDCFESFAFPDGWQKNGDLETVGNSYFEHRAQIMVANNEGLTATYTRFHDPNERDSGILKLRELQAGVDRAVLDTYGWTDLQPTSEFLLDYDDEEEEGARRRKPWRYRWPDEFRDEVLARLLQLNRQRASGAALD